MSLRVTEIRYTRFMVVCTACDEALMRYGSFRSWENAERHAKEKGWSVWPFTPQSDLLAGGIHYCPTCAEKMEGNRAE